HDILPAQQFDGEPNRLSGKPFPSMYALVHTGNSENFARRKPLSFSSLRFPYRQAREFPLWEIDILGRN
ncbi:MAG: hypothetical protein ACRD3Q_17900, partial [Terriglobales bacterium]